MTDSPPAGLSPASTTALHAAAVSMSSAASPRSPGQMAGIASGCWPHHCSTCAMSSDLDLKPPDTSGALSCPQGKTGHPPPTNTAATSIIGRRRTPTVEASMSASSGRSDIGVLDVRYLEVVYVVRPH